MKIWKRIWNEIWIRVLSLTRRDPPRGGRRIEARRAHYAGPRRVHGLFGRGDKRDLNTVEASGPSNLYDIASLRNYIGYPQQENVAVLQKQSNMQYHKDHRKKVCENL